MSMQSKIPVVMRKAINQYTDIRDELEDFRDFLQDICCDIGGAAEEINDQLEDLYDRLIAYNEAAEKYIYLSDCLHQVYPSSVTTATEKKDMEEEEELPFPLTDNMEAV